MNDLSILDEEEITQLIGAGFSLFFTCSYFLSLYKLYKEKFIYEDFPIISLFFCYFNNLMWTKYSDLIYHESMKSLFQYSNIISCILIILYSLYEIRKDIIDMGLNILILITSTFAIKKLLMDILKEEEKVKIACGYSMVIFYLSCLEWIYRAKSAKNTNIMNLASGILFFGIAICWVYYGIKYKNNKYYTYPNLLGIVVGIFYFITWYYLKKSYGYAVPIIIQEEQSNKKDNKEKENKENNNNTENITELKEKTETEIKCDTNNDDEHQKVN